MMCGSALSNQLGAATGVLAFPVIGPAGVVAVRQWIAGIALLVAVRPRWRTFTWAQWWPVLLLAAVYGTMNLSLYTAIDRLGLGLAVTLEFCGPLAVALAGSRRRADLACALVAAAGVVTLTRPRPSTDYAAGGLSALVFVPIGIAVLVTHPPTVTALACAAAAGILSSALPYLTDLFTLRRVPARYFGIFMSVNPVLAAIIGLTVLGQSLPWSAWLSIAAIVGADVVTSVRPHGEDHRHGDDRRTRHSGDAQPLAEDDRRQDRAGQGLEQRQQGRRTGRDGPQAAEVERVGHGGRAGPQSQEQTEGPEVRAEAEAADGCGQRHQRQAAEDETEAGHGRLVQSGHRP
jgi:inner membrane transporter RhtA